MEVECLRHPGASTIGSQLLDGDRSHGWQIQATQQWAPTPKERNKKQWKEREAQGRGDSLQGVPTLRKTLMLRNTLTKTSTKLLQCPMDQEHEESWLMRISNKPLTVRVKLVLLVVNSVKLHLTALNYFQQMHLVGAPVSLSSSRKCPHFPNRRDWNFLGGVGVLDQKC